MYVNPTQQESLLLKATHESMDQVLRALDALFHEQIPQENLMAIACMKKSIRLLDFLFPYCNIDYQDRLGYTPVHLCAIKGYYREMKWFLDHGCKRYNQSAFGTDLVSDCKNLECRNLVLEYQTRDRMLYDLWKVGRCVSLPFDIRYRIARYLVDKDVVKLLDLFERDSIGRLPLHLPFSFPVLQQYKNGTLRNE
jgi:hypothetical protein